MNKASPLKILVAATLIGIAAENARAEGAAPGAPAASAGQAAAPGTGYVPGRYPPGPDRYGYAQPWPWSSQRPAPLPGGQARPYPPPYGQYPAESGVPVEDPLDTRLKQTQDRLAAQSTELQTARDQLARLQADFEAATAALQKAQSDTVNAGRQVDTSMAQVDTLKKILCELAARIENRNTALQNALQASAEVPDDPDGADAGKVEAETVEQAEPWPDPRCAQTPPPAITSGQRGITIETLAR